MVQLSGITISFNKMGKPSEKEILHMKKLLSVVLAMLMVMSTVSFAAPSMADTFGATEEVVSENVPAVEADVQDEAALAEESEYGTLVYTLDFEDAAEGAAIPLGTGASGAKDFATVGGKAVGTLPEGMPTAEQMDIFTSFIASSIVEETDEAGNVTNKYALLQVTGNNHPGFPRVYISSHATGGKYVDGTYTIMADVETLKNGNVKSASAVTCVRGSDQNYGSKSITAVGAKATIVGTYAFANGKQFYDNKVHANTTNLTQIHPVLVFLGYTDSTAETDYAVKFDNMKVYYKPNVTISFDGGTVTEETVADVAWPDGIQYNFADAPKFANVGNYQHIGWSLTEGGERIKGTSITLSEDTTLYAVWADMRDEKKGDLLYVIDFEGNTSVASEDKITKHGYVNNKYEGSDSWKIVKTGQSQNWTLVTEEDNTYFRMERVKSQYTMMQVNAANSKAFAENGYYTLEADIYWCQNPNTTATKFQNPSFRYLNQFYDTENNKNVQSATNVGTTAGTEYKEKWYSHSVVEGQKLLNGGSDKNGGIGTIQAIHFHSTAEDAYIGSNYLMFDNMKMYWKPFEAKLTIDVNGNDEAQAIEPITWDTKNAVTLAAVKEYFSDTDSKKLVGISSKANGKPEDEIWLTGDETVYLLWKTHTPVVENSAEYGKLLMHLDFETAAGVYNHTDENGNVIRYLNDGTGFSGYASNFACYTSTDYGFDATKVAFDVRGARNEDFCLTSKGAVTQAVILETDENNDTHAKIQHSTGDYTMLNFAKSGGLTTENGVYTVVYDVMSDTPDFANLTPTYAWYNTTVNKAQTSYGSRYPWNNPVSGQWSRDVALVSPHTDADGVLLNFMVGIDSAAGAENTYVHLDNIRLYFKPFTVDVTIDANGNDDVEDVVYEASTKAMVSVSELNNKFADTEGKKFLGVSLTPDGELLTEDFWAWEPVTVYAQWQDIEVSDEQHGKLLMFVDFENIDKNADVYTTDSEGREFLYKNVSWVGAVYFNPAFADLDTANISIWPESSKSYNASPDQHMMLGEEEGNTYASIYAMNNALVMAWIRNDTYTEFYKPGNYTVVYDVNASSEIIKLKKWYELGYTPSGTTSRKNCQFINETTVSLAADTWHRDNVSYFPYSIVEGSVSKSGEECDTLTGFNIGVDVAKGTTVKYDNIRLYYKPAAANITINMNGNTDKTVEAYVNDTSSVLSLEALASHVGAETANYTLVGFSKTADGEVLTEDFWANEDMTLYAVWEAKTVVAPESYDVSSIRTDAYTGIRFMSSVTAAQKAEVTEYGFIVTLVDLLGDKELTHDSGVTYVEGVNYDVEEGVDKIFNIEDDNIFFTAVVHGMPKTAVGYQTEFVVRPFTKRDGYYYYGAPVQRSICAVAEKIRDNGYPELSDDAIEVVKGILTTCGKSTETVSE